MSVMAGILNKLREKGCITQRGDDKWVGDWDERTISPVTLETMKSFGHIELVERKSFTGAVYPAYVITDVGRIALEGYEAQISRKRLIQRPDDPEK
jgi:uncharacterized UBP type Zn finger protein